MILLLTQNPNDKRQTMEVSRFHYYLNTVKCLPNVGLSALAVEILEFNQPQASSHMIEGYLVLCQLMELYV